MLTGSSLLRSILRQVAMACAAQLALLSGVWAGYQVPWRELPLPIAATAGWHLLLGAFLVARRADFRLEATGAPLSRVNLPNTLTIGRLSSIPTILLLVLLAPRYPVLPVALPFVCLVFATDFIDGIVARRRGEITFVGRYLDSSSDYAMIIAVSILFLVWGMIPAWFFILLMVRLVLFALGMTWAALRRGKVQPVATFLGKASVASVMVLYALEVAELFGVPAIGNPVVVRVAEYAAAVIVAVSLADKAIFLHRLLRGADGDSV